MKVLVTGGTGYIGSNTVVELLENDYEVVIIDNLLNSNLEVINDIRDITGKKVTFEKVDCRNYEELKLIFEREKPDVIMHFAGYKAVGESVKNPLKYYDNNLKSTITLLQLMNEYNCKNFIFSSSATVYSEKNDMPLNENAELKAKNPYGQTKLMIEYILKDLYLSNNDFNIVILRYFNPLGAHKSGLLGDRPNGIPNNLMPHILDVAMNKKDKLTVYGGDYPTKDGTGVRDYIHVIDLAKGHLLALKNIENKCGFCIYNLGNGKGYSVLEVLNEMNKVSGLQIPYIIGERRDGDVAICYADSLKAKKELGFEPIYDLHEMCLDSWNFAIKHTKKD